jgi:PAS domain S-box-containing protein
VAWMPLGVFVMAVNPFCAEQLGYAVNKLVGQPVLNVFYGPDREAVERHVAICLKQIGQSTSWEFHQVRKNGSMLGFAKPLERSF